MASNWSSSGSADEEARGYQPVLAERVKHDAEYAPSPAAQWPKDTMHVYTNDLFTEGPDSNPAEEEHRNYVLQPKQPQYARPEAPTSAKQAVQQRSTLASRRAERLQANMYQTNNTQLPTAGSQPKPSTPTSRSQQDDTPSVLNSDTTTSSSVYGLKATYDPDEEKQGRQIHANGNSNARQQRPVPRSLDLTNLPNFLMQPGPKDGQPIMCYIIRDKGSTKMYPRYNLFLEDPKVFLLAARKRKKQTTSNYIISLDPEELNRDSAKIFGKLRANFVGTEFNIYDGGDKPNRKGQQHDSENGGSRTEIGAITYQYNVLGTRGPRKMMGVIPALDNGGRSLYQPASETDNMLERVRTNRSCNELVVMRNKPPRWNDELNAYCLNFNGRVTEASVKNFQLVTDDDPNHVILQFGKIGKNTFTMDYMWPMNAFQAFSMCLSAFDNKLACE